MNAFLDQPQPVRAGEALDVAKLADFLKDKLGISAPLHLEQFPSGYSNLTYLVRAGDQAWVLRRPPFGARIKSAHDMGREYRILSKLIQVYPRVPRPVLFCEDESVLGAPFYLMERAQGVILRKEIPAGLELSPYTMCQLSEEFVDNLAAIHAVDVHAAGLSDLGQPQGYVQRQIEGWTQRYWAAKTDEVPGIERAIRWLSQYMPEQQGSALIHNDYKYDNLVLDPDTLHVKAVLDWEMATLGDPLLDLGTTLGYWVQADDPQELQSLRFCLTHLPGNLTRVQLVERYAQRSGLDVSDALYCYVYGLFKIAVIVQQIYKRYRSGSSQDARFASLIEGVFNLGKVAALAIEKGRLDQLG